MKNLKIFFSVVIITLFFSSCANVYRLKLSSPKEIKSSQKFTVTVTEKDKKPIDSIRYYLDGSKLSSNIDIDASKLRLGSHAISATIFYADKQKKLTNTIVFLADNPPQIYTYSIVNEYPHDEKAFTQGLEYHNGFLYESTGQNGKSSLRKVEITTGKVLQKIDIDKKYFGEGMTIFNDEIFMLTWQNKIGFVFNLDTFKKERTFNYAQSIQGWGLTHDDKNLIKSDGTKKLWFLNPKTGAEEFFIETYTTDRAIDELNELEYLNGVIYANVWQRNSIIMVNPKTGALEGIADLKGLQKKSGQKGSEKVLNGIAYDAENDRLFVTGKNWNKLFEIKLQKKQ